MKLFCTFFLCAIQKKNQFIKSEILFVLPYYSFWCVHTRNWFTGQNERTKASDSVTPSIKCPPAPVSTLRSSPPPIPGQSLCPSHSHFPKPKLFRFGFTSHLINSLSLSLSITHTFLPALSQK